MNEIEQLLQSLLNELFEYKNGHLVRIKAVVGRRSNIGDVAGSPVSGGYLNITINQKKYRAHKLVWLMFNGCLPKGEIDHINGVRSDNRIENLREVTRVENARNQQIRSNNTSGITGVRFNLHIGKWESYIKVNYKKEYLGSFDKKEDAIKARKNADKEYRFHENHGRQAVDNDKIVTNHLRRIA